MGRLGKCFGKGIHSACSEEQGDSDGDPFVPNDFAEDDSFQVSEVLLFFACVFFFRFVYCFCGLAYLVQ